MKPASCPRAFEAEAARDGRLAGAALASFARHLTACGACSREAKALEGLTEGLRAGLPETEGPADELHVLRERLRLLSAFDRSLVGATPPPGRGAARRLLWRASVVAVAAFAVVLWRMGRPAAPARAESALVHSAPAAVWSRRVSADREEIVLVRGALSIRVDHASHERRVVVLLPDGEVEDIGTVFTVSAADGRTVRISVDEGIVMLRLRGRPPVVVTAGNAWSAPPQTSPIDVAAPAAPAPRAATASVGIPALPARAAATSLRRPSAPIAAASRAADAATDFRTALAALDAGANRDAAAAFARFVAAYPGEARAEDAAYLRVIALQRSGADAAMRNAAAEYLRLYPAALRRAEIVKLSAPVAPPP